MRMNRLSNRATSRPRRKPWILPSPATGTSKAADSSTARWTLPPWADWMFAGNLFRIRLRPELIPRQRLRCCAFTLSREKTAIALCRKNSGGLRRHCATVRLVRSHLWTCGDAVHKPSFANRCDWHGRRLGGAITGTGRAPNLSFRQSRSSRDAGNRPHASCGSPKRNTSKSSRRPSDCRSLRRSNLPASGKRRDAVDVIVDAWNSRCRCACLTAHSLFLRT